MALLIVFADEREAADSRGLHPNIVITGWGPENAREAILQHRDRVEEIWNFGVVGSVRGEPIGTVKEVGQLSHEGAPTVTIGEGWHLLSVDQPLYSFGGLECDVVDMEGYAIAEAAGEIPVRLFKAVSDYGSSQQIRENLPLCSRRLADRLRIELRAKHRLPHLSKR